MVGMTSCLPQFHGYNVTVYTPAERILNNMALKFAANLSFTFLEHKNFLDRYQAAKKAGDVLEYVNYSMKY